MTAQFPRRRAVGHGDDFRVELRNLLGDHIRAAIGGNADDLHAVGQIPRDFECAGANGACGTKNDDFSFHDAKNLR
ncbi:hypothetical protein QQ055_10575 [Geitlerinema calcuttense NRMC-F 0142]|uniref:Uncharacterized protein n=1 Tax=Geitlerinema calcuttense NRMC-F 0142 TaxID=2922238 RepID=A0ABT7M0V2_9CYAN|nr:hypothetical protein [Geitlerinema calcuttense]MDL5057892.1 hypothetical protein [Geitlerinema calcuttense NRMC-F 0142]